MNYIDAHIHLDFYSSMDRTVEKMCKNNVDSVFVTHLPELYLSYYKKRDQFPNTHIALGHHPNLIEEYPFNARQFEEGLKTAYFIGEVGLDYYITKSEEKRTKQKQVFEYVCKNAQDKVISIHSRKSEDDILEILAKWNVKKAVFHWYTGKIKVIDEILKSGYYFSLNPMMLASSNGKNIIKKIPLNRILIESDGPFSKYRGKITSPDMFSSIYKDFADFYEVGLDSFINQVNNNFFALAQSDMEKGINLHINDTRTYPLQRQLYG